MSPVDPGKPDPPPPQKTPDVPTRDRFQWLGAPMFSREDMIYAAEAFGAGRVFLELVDAFYHEYALRLRTQGAPVLAPDAQLVRVSIETGWGKVHAPTGRYLRSPGVPGDSAPYNPLGIKKADHLVQAVAAANPPRARFEMFDLNAEGTVRVALNENDVPKMFERPATAAAGAKLGYNHTGAYFGIAPLEPVNSRFPAARAVAAEWYRRNGRWPTYFTDWGNGLWATDPSYAAKIKQRQAEIAQAIVNRGR